jgi:ribonuclease Z
MARLIFLGTAAALPTADRTNTALAIVPDMPGIGNGLLIDSGGDVYCALLRAGLGPDAISDLFITHAHIDHIGSLPSLLESFRLGGRCAPLRIWASSPVLEVAHGLVRVFGFELKLDQWPYDITFTPVEHGQSLTLAGLPAQTFSMDHTVPTLGLRLELPDGVLAYTCDTQPNPHIAELSQNAKTLITESTFLNKYVAEARSTRHLTAHEAGQLAAACGAERLALVHLGATPEELRAEAAQAFSGEIIVPNDGDTLTV